MTSERQAEANRQNAQKSTGPRTPAGKAVVALNGAKHGLLSRECLLKGEILGEVEAPDVAAAKAAAAVQFDLDKIQRNRIMVQELG